MDVLAHGLWGGVGFYARGWKVFLTALLLGMAPDLLSFGIFHITRPSWIKLRLLGEISGPPPLSTLPAYVFHAYNLTHSLVIWALIFAALWLLRRQVAWLWFAWGLHILCDIPTHSSSYFPTPYLWPFPTPFVDGISWAEAWFMASNYLALAAAYVAMLLWVGRSNAKGAPRRGGVR